MLLAASLGRRSAPSTDHRIPFAAYCGAHLKQRHSWVGACTHCGGTVIEVGRLVGEPPERICAACGRSRTPSQPISILN